MAGKHYKTKMKLLTKKALYNVNEEITPKESIIVTEWRNYQCMKALETQNEKLIHLKVLYWQNEKTKVVEITKQIEWRITVYESTVCNEWKINSYEGIKIHEWNY